jgi:hypothetical protein
MNVRMLFSVNLVGRLDTHGDCKNGLFEDNGVLLKSQVFAALCQVYIRKE